VHGNRKRDAKLGGALVHLLIYFPTMVGSAGGLSRPAPGEAFSKAYIYLKPLE